MFNYYPYIHILHNAYRRKYKIFVPNHQQSGEHFLEICSQLLIFAQVTMLKQDRTIIHVEVKDTHEHFYFGSAAAMYEDSRVKNLLKIAYQTFRKRRVSAENPYENDFVIVRKGALNTILHDQEIESELL